MKLTALDTVFPVHYKEIRKSMKLLAPTVGDFNKAAFSKLPRSITPSTSKAIIGITEWSAQTSGNQLALVGIFSNSKRTQIALLTGQKSDSKKLHGQQVKTYLLDIAGLTFPHFSLMRNSAKDPYSTYMSHVYSKLKKGSRGETNFVSGVHRLATEESNLDMSQVQKQIKGYKKVGLTNPSLIFISAEAQNNLKQGTDKLIMQTEAMSYDEDNGINTHTREIYDLVDSETHDPTFSRYQDYGFWDTKKGQNEPGTMRLDYFIKPYPLTFASDKDSTDINAQKTPVVEETGSYREEEPESFLAKQTTLILNERTEGMTNIIKETLKKK